MPTRVWRIVHSEASLGWGGQEHRVLAELTGFRRRGHHVALLAPVESQVFQRATAAGIPCAPLRIGRLRFPFEVVRLARWLRRERADIVNPHSSADGWLVGVAGRLARVPLMIRSRHIDVTYPNAWLSRHAFTTLADHVLTTSDKITAHFQEVFHLPPARITTVPTGIDLEQFSPAGQRAELPLPPGPADAPVIGMVSVLRSWKGHPTFLEAARRLRDEGFAARFVIVGEGPMQPVITRQIAELGLAESVRLAGHREDVPAVLRALNALVIASTKHEGVPQIGLQALACRTPVVGSDAGGTPEIIRAGETGRNFPAGDAAALAAALRAACTETAATQTMTERGRQRVERQHSLDHMLDRLEEIYRRHLPA
jgi:glycosyltransferase involved in cell wall biosynthesis